MKSVLQILKGTSLRGLISDLELSEIASEIQTEIDEHMEDIEEEKDDEISELEDEIRELKKDIEHMESSIDDLESKQIVASTIDDLATIGWVKENWDYLIQFEKMGLSGRQIKSDMSYLSTLNSIAKDSSTVVAKMVDNMILEKVVSLKSKRIILVGRAASGKDHLRKLFEEKGFKYAVSYTTRPPRMGEVDGKDYIFLSNEKFQEMIENDEFYEYVTFNGWDYGTTKEQFYNDDVFIMTPHGISCVNEEDRKNSMIIYLDMPLEVRRERLQQRSDADTVDRRLAADDVDFCNFTTYDIKITDPNF